MSAAELLSSATPTRAPQGSPRPARGPWLDDIDGWDEELRYAWWAESFVQQARGLSRPRAEAKAYLLVCKEQSLTPAPWLAGPPPGGSATAEALDDAGSAPGGRPTVHPLCCGGCGCVSLTEHGHGPCWRCGWRKGGAS